MLNSDALTDLLRRSPLLYVDAGARGDLEGEWRNFPAGCLSVLAFEPDESAVIDWENADGSRHIERSALWSSETEVNIHIGKVGSTSSVWPPNLEYLARFSDAFVDPRRTQSIARVKARPLDAILREHNLTADFLKIDTQGAELQILQGAPEALENSIIGAVIETWTVPVHKGQGLTHDVMALMQGKGFVVCQIATAAAWERKVFERDKISYNRQIVGLDILFLRDPAAIVERFASSEFTAKFAVIAQMYGHYDLALEAIDLGISAAGPDTDLLRAARDDILKAHAATAPAPASCNIWQKIRNRLRPVPRTATTKLHY